MIIDNEKLFSVKLKNNEIQHFFTAYEAEQFVKQHNEQDLKVTCNIMIMFAIGFLKVSIPETKFKNSDENIPTYNFGENGFTGNIANIEDIENKVNNKIKSAGYDKIYFHEYLGGFFVYKDNDENKERLFYYKDELITEIEYTKLLQAYLIGVVFKEADRQETERKLKEANRKLKQYKKQFFNQPVKEAKHLSNNIFKTKRDSLQCFFSFFEINNNIDKNTKQIGFNFNLAESRVLDGLIILLNQTNYKGNFQNGNIDILPGETIPLIRLKLTKDDLFLACGIEKKISKRNKLETSQKERQTIEDGLNDLLTKKRPIYYKRLNKNTKKSDLMFWQEPIIKLYKTKENINTENIIDLNDLDTVIEFHPIFIDQMEGYYLQRNNPLIIQEILKNKKIKPSKYLIHLIRFIENESDNIRRNNVKATKNKTIQARDFIIEKPFIEIAEAIWIPENLLNRKAEIEKRLISYYGTLKEIGLIKEVREENGIHYITVYENWSPLKT